MTPHVYRENAKRGVRWWRCDCSKPCAHWQCLSCKHRWRAFPDFVDCVHCGACYVEWTNYRAWRKSHGAAPNC